MTGGTEHEIEVEEWWCRGCASWTEPEFQAGDPAICTCCDVEYPPGADRRTRTWPRCGSYDTDDGTPCGNHVDQPGQRCEWHRSQDTGGGA